MSERYEKGEGTRNKENSNSQQTVPIYINISVLINTSHQTTTFTCQMIALAEESNYILFK